MARKEERVFLAPPSPDPQRCPSSHPLVSRSPDGSPATPSRGSARTRAHLRENGLFLSFPYVRPEPVLVKRSFLYTNGSSRPFSRTTFALAQPHPPFKALNLRRPPWHDGILRILIDQIELAPCVWAFEVLFRSRALLLPHESVPAPM